MSFLDKINAAKNPAAAAEKKVNPLLKQPAPAIKPATAPAVAQAAPVVTPLTKPNPLLKPITPAATAPVTDPAVSPVKKTLTLPFKKKAEEVKVAPEVPVKAPKVEEPITPETAVVAEPAIEPTPATAEEKKTTRKSSRKKTEVPIDGPGIDVDSASNEMVDMPTTTMSFSEAAAVLTSPFADETWDTFKVEIEEELNAVIVDQDMNPGVLKVVLSELNIVYDKIAKPLHEARTLLENLTNKDDGTIALVKSISLGGNNDMERKRAGFLSAMNYKPKTGGGNINLFEAAAEVRSRYNFLKSIHDRLKYKSDTLITMNGALKLERDFAARGDN